MLKQLTAIVIRKVEADLKGKKWQHIVLDVRYDKRRASWQSKMRAATPGKETVSVRMSNDIDLLLISLNAMRGMQKDEWYGLRMEIDSTQQCKTTLNYDSNCSEGKAFYET